MKTAILATILLSTAIAFADVAPVPPDPAAPAPVDPAAPPAPTADKPAEPPATPATPPTPAGPTAAQSTAPTTSALPKGPVEHSFDTVGVEQTAEPKKGNPKIAIELSGTGSYTANDYVEYKGWTLKTGANKGFRLEANLIGIQVAYELSSMANDQACGPSGCLTGSFGSTRFHSFELGYRFRFSRLGPVRPFVAASIGGVLASSGDWSMQTSKTVYGGSGRAGFGIEIPIADRFFASATIAYRITVTQNPLRDKGAEKANKILVGGDVPNGDYAEDSHLISGYVGFGVEL